ncbi:MAG: ABC transporter transmembrane domain-containing protein, partial [Rothia sp. (in: high G+C Gram-positive bacteria)]|nr:ABC transporter transmembrane domain-containing protein [Rothia sp. (in: high G+C Gram-positive bacteria)]
MTETNKKEPLAKVKFRLAPPGFTWRPTYFLPFGFTVLAAIGMVFLPVLVGRIIELHSQGDASSAWGLMTWMLLIVAGLSFHEKFTWGITFKLIARLEKEWRLYISSMVARSSDRDAGSLIAILNKDSRAMAMLWQPLVPASSGVALTILGTWQLWVISPTVAVVVLAGLIVTVWALTVISKFLEKHADAFRDTVGKSTSRASDIAASIRTILGLGAQGQMMKRYGKNAQEVYLAQLK